MKGLKFVMLLCGVLCAGAASAQFSISHVTPAEVATKPITDSIKTASSITNEFFNKTRYKEQRKQIRLERNQINFTSTLATTQTGFSNWATGGDNTFSVRGAVAFTHVYTRNRLQLNYGIQARYGMNRIDTTSFKNEDAFQLDLGAAWKINKNWSYSATGLWSSQFSKGYKSSTDNTLVSDFMSPAKVNVAVGFNYQHQTKPLQIILSPIGGSLTIVRNDSLKATYGIDPNRTTLSTMGSSLTLNYAVATAKEKLAYKTYLYTFSNYGDNNYVKWDNTLTYTIYKLFTISAFCSTIYDQTVMGGEKGLVQPIQMNYSLGLGLTYTFKNK